MIEFCSIGTITSPFERSEDMPIQSGGASGIQGTIVLNPEFQEGLKDLGGFTDLSGEQQWSFSLPIPDSE